MSSGDAKNYLSKRNVPALFECLMTGLMFHRPTDHIQYLIECLEKVKAKGQEEMRWNMFVEMQRSKTPLTPLPPITPTNGRRPISRERSMTPKEEAVPEARSRTPTPLPPIGNIPDVPVIFVTGGPGSGSFKQAQLLHQKLSGWVMVPVGELLREEVRDKGTASSKWKMVGDLMSDGEMAPEDVVETVLLTKIKSSPRAEGFIIQGFPRDMDQVTNFDSLVGRLDAVFLVDCEEEAMSQQLLARAKASGRLDNNVNTIARRLQAFRDKTLPVLKHYDDKGKLVVLEGEQKEEEIADDLARAFESVVGSNGKLQLAPAPPKEPKPERVRSARSGRATPKKSSSSPEPAAAEEGGATAAATGPLPAHLMPPEVTVKDEGRKPDMPQAPIIFIAGGPASGKGTQCKRLLSRYTKAVHLSMGDILRTKIATEGSADAKWGMVTDLLRQGEMAPEDVTVDLLTSSLKSQPDAHFYLVEGFPRNLEQLEDFNKQIGGQSFTILLDCEESILHYRLSMRGKNSERIDDNLTAIGKKLTFFKNNTLPILKTIEDSGKLVAVDGDRDEDEIQYDLCMILDYTIYGREPEQPGAADNKEPTPVTEETFTPLPAHLMPPEVTVKDEGRKPDMPQAAIVFVAGGPASGKGTQCKRLLSRYTKAVHLSMGDILRTKIATEGSADAKWGMVTDLLRQGEMAPEDVTVDLLTSSLKSQPDAHFYLVEGFPRNLEQLEDFNKQVGGQSFTILLDCDESVLLYRLSMRGKKSERIDDNLTAIGKKVNFFKNNTLPILKTIEDSGKLVAVDGDRDEDEIQYDLCMILDYAIYGREPEQLAAAENKEPVTEEVIEAASATTTGDNIANPSHTAQLDATADAAK
ncbi:adenylate kinase isoenzyme 5-like [Babylonia areolata]|uniref:adenylate kinase isoenzyme 5-like n=1 Tax=Babylonia areolata TaxID=304850 RepID=UPI003FD14678